MLNSPPAKSELAARVEAHFFTAWPAMGEMDLDGWRVRIAGGYSDRANSTTPLVSGLRPAADKVRWCETFYGTRHLPAMFRITELCPEPELDGWLQARGYKKSWVMETAVRELASPPRPPGHVRLVDQADPDWRAAAMAVDPRLEPHRVPFSFILDHMPRPKVFARIDTAGVAVAVGAATAADDLMAVFLMRTRADHQRRGHGRAVLDALLAWGAARGARTAWLQFDRDRDAPLALYRRAGFAPLYAYHYRTKAS